MSSVVVAVDGPAARQALAESSPRLVDLVRSLRRPNARALGAWTSAEVAAHLAHAYEGLLRLAKGEQSSFISEFWDLAEATQSWVRADPERDPGVLAARIEAAAAEFLALTAGGSLDRGCGWLGDGTTISLASLTCHLLNETLVHGHDLAQAEGRRWSIDPGHATLVLIGFIVPTFQRLDPRTFVDQGRGAGVRAVFDIRLRGRDRARMFFVIDRGTLSVEAPSARHKVDCVVSADPSAFLLVAWGRQSQWGAAGRGRITAWGRRPWRAFELATLMRHP